MKKVLFVVIACCLCVVSSSSFARTGSGKDECYGPLLPVNPTPPVESEVPVHEPMDEKSVATSSHHKSWWDKHGDSVIVGVATSAVFVGVMVYAFGFEHSNNDPTKVKLAEF